MSNVIIGTAGHVDHGKTCLISALTGIDTDRLDEEKRRGITIELGFAYLDLPNGQKAGIIDVPGHEKFIKNMLAGVGGMDMVLLVIAADEGVMPQTKEHLDILSMLDIKNGIVVITKSDMVEDDWMEFVIDDVKDELKDTFLQDSLVIPVSSHTGSGIDKLKQEIVNIVENAQPKNVDKSFRIPVDRVFTVKGFGTVITGTMIEGTASVGDNVSIYPEGVITKIRNIQVHGKDVVKAYAGQRTAINLAKVKTSEVKRGDTLAQPDSMEQTTLLDVKLNAVKDAKRVIEDRSKVHFYHGTKSILSKIVLLDKPSLKSDESCYAQLMIEEELAVKAGDRFIIRFYSPLETIGGGEILDAKPSHHHCKNFDKVAKSLMVKENGTPSEKVMQAIIEHSVNFADIDYISKHLGMNVDETMYELENIKDCDEIVCISDNIYVHVEFIDKLRKKVVDSLASYHEKNPLEMGMKKDELKHRILSNAYTSIFDSVMDIFVSDKSIKQDGQGISLIDFSVKISKAQQNMMDDLEKTYQEKGYTAPTMADLKAKYSKELVNLRQVIQLMQDKGILIKISEQIFIDKEHLLKTLEITESIQRENGEISLGEFRDRLETSRKYALPILEYFDKQHVTDRNGDIRKLNYKHLQTFRGVL